MAVPGLSADGLMIHFFRSSGPLLGTAPPAIRVREATPARFGPMAPLAPGMPGIAWHAPQPFWASSVLPASTRAGSGAAPGAAGALPGAPVLGCGAAPAAPGAAAEAP